MSTHPSAIIIGAGVAGLAVATRLAIQKFNVTVFEKNRYPGGKLSHFALGDYNFDAGPSLFTQPQNIVELFELAGEPIEEYFQFEKVPFSCKYFFENGTVINAFADITAFAEEMKVKTGEDPEKVISYLQQSRKLYEEIGTVFLDYSISKKNSLLKAPLIKAIKATRLKFVVDSLNDLNTKHFTRPETIQLFNRFATYNGSNPFKAPGMLSLIPHLEFGLGTFYPKGGMKSITDALYKLALKKGVKFNFESPVQRIINVDGWVKGVVVNNANFYGDIVVSNSDVYFTYKHLLRDDSKAKKSLKQERSSSALIFYWGIKKEFSELQLHNIFFSEDYKNEFEHLFEKKTISEDPTIYINITSKMESGQAGEGKENWFVMINAPANEEQDWELLKSKCREAVITKLNRMLNTDVESYIEVEETLDPVKIEEQTSSFMGALYGTSSNSRMAAFLRHPNFSSTIKGLYFAGGTVHPGGGIPLCLKSARLVSELVKSDIKGLVSHH
ncbi:1-hydroxycarotenoid 3,4-desaturase CrtD [Segetibacter koreensis]|uniref:1-hydroxycarotenoid 3,4-desaturase CrtD n=1 Tax=Segetibacter koreensis TaxID=398037 RepID=UPI0003614460|nr:1-hydroxycarotenoid 3,4-desaturase CrtD [Segetibacter koreensis]